MSRSRIPHPGYEWSQDYDLLLKLLEQGEVMGTVVYLACNDPVTFWKRNTSEFTYGASCRGIHYIETWCSSKFASQEEEFKAQCAEQGARFLVPTNPEASA